jgi:hypothetical protein
LPKLIDYFAHGAISAFWVQRGMSGALLGNAQNRHDAMLTLGAHAIIFLAAAVTALVFRDRRHEA